MVDSEDRVGLRNRWLVRRRRLDRVLAAVAGVPGAALAALLAVAIRATSPGSPVIGLDRVGRGEAPFTMWKLRTMHQADPGSDASVLTLTDDDRITPVGRLLRRMRVDELPQLLNVLQGDMAIIGPRPETPSLVDADDPAWAAVLAAAPGIAGPTQVMVHEWEATLPDLDTYRTRILPVKLAIDRWYVEHASARVDGLVVVAIAQSLLGRRRRTVLHDRIRLEVPEARTIPEPA